MTDTNICDIIRSPLVRPLGLKRVELPFLYQHLLPGNALVVGEGGEGGVEGVSATVATHPKITSPIECIDMCSYKPDSYLAQAVEAGTHHFIHGDFTSFPVPADRYTNVVCINVLEHFLGTETNRGIIDLNYDLKGLRKMMEVCSHRIILTIPYGWRCLIDDHIPTARNYTPERMKLVRKEIDSGGFEVSRDVILMNQNLSFENVEITDEQFAVVSHQQPYQHEYLRLLVLNRKPSSN